MTNAAPATQAPTPTEGALTTITIEKLKPRPFATRSAIPALKACASW